MRQQVRRLKKGRFPHRCRDLNQQIPALGTDYTIECPQDPVLELFFGSSVERPRPYIRPYRLCHGLEERVKKHRANYSPRSTKLRWAIHIEIVWIKFMCLRLITLCQVTFRGGTSTFDPYQYPELIRIFPFLASVSWML